MAKEEKDKGNKTTNLQDPAIINSFYWKVGYKQNIGSREEQQDSVGVVLGDARGKEVLLAVLADGMGGMHDGARFSQIVVESHVRHFQEALEQFERYPSVLAHLAVLANQEAHKIYDDKKPGGATLISVLFVGDYFYALSVGDSRITLYRKPEQRRANKNMMVPLQINREHVLGAALDERAWMGFISYEDAEGNMYRGSLLSSLGDETIRRVDLMEKPVRFLSEDRVVLMSDGIYRSVDEKEMAPDLEAEPSIAADNVVQHVLEKQDPDQDNMSIIVIEKKTTNTVIY